MDWFKSDGTYWADPGNTSSGSFGEIRFDDVERAAREVMHRYAEPDRTHVRTEDPQFGGLERAAMAKLIRNRIATTTDRGELQRALDTLTALGREWDPTQTFPKARAAIHQRIAALI